MKIYDITQELFSCKTFPGDPVPVKETPCSMDKGDLYNMTAFSMCAHNGTHVDTPFHFLNDGKKIDQVGLEPFVGSCYVTRHEGNVTAEDAEKILNRAGSIQRILIAGAATVTEAAAHVFAERELKLLGNESQTVGPENAPMQVHRILLASGMVLLEGVVLHAVPEGNYFLSAAPLNLGGAEGAPCRAYLIPWTECEN